MFYNPQNNLNSTLGVQSTVNKPQANATPYQPINSLQPINDIQPAVQPAAVDPSLQPTVEPVPQNNSYQLNGSQGGMLDSGPVGAAVNAATNINDKMQPTISTMDIANPNQSAQEGYGDMIGATMEAAGALNPNENQAAVQKQAGSMFEKIGLDNPFVNSDPKQTTGVINQIDQQTADMRKRMMGGFNFIEGGS